MSVYTCENVLAFCIDSLIIYGYKVALIEGIAAPGCDVKVMTCINTQTYQHEIWLYAGGSVRNIQLMDIACLTNDMTNATTYFDEIYDSIPESGYSNFFYIIGSA